MLEGRMQQRTGQLCFYGLNLAAANLHRLHRERAGGQRLGQVR
jgi:hypothetical protein